jgi:hypothetical protein
MSGLPNFFDTVEKTKAQSQIKTEDLEAIVDALVNKKLGERLPHVCSTCDLFTFNKEAKKGVPRNRYCQYSGELKLVKGVCQTWVLATDLSQRHPRNITI